MSPLQFKGQDTPTTELKRMKNIQHIYLVQIE